MATIPAASSFLRSPPWVSPLLPNGSGDDCKLDALQPGTLPWEEQRLSTLDRYDILDTPREQAFDRITRLTKKLFQVRFVLINLIDAHRAWAKSTQGLEFDEAPRSASFCQHTLLEKRFLIVPDATLDARFAQNPYVTGAPHLRFYVGAPLTMSDGQNIGTLCIFDIEPRVLTTEELDLMSDLARIVVDELELRLLATRDSLTGALSRRAFKAEAERAAALALRHHHDLSCVTFDLDHFKTINDTHGHSAGDTVLKAVVQAAIGELREADLIGRLGGEEFAVLLPHTAAPGAFEVAEKLRSAIKRLTFEFGSGTGATASFGIASLDGTIRDSETLLKHADAALYQAKAAGRDQAIAWRTSETPNVQQLRRVLKGGQILFNGGTSVIDCTVRGLSENGAAIDVSTTVGIPKSFNLSIAADNVQKTCRIVSQSEKRIEVEFFPTARAA